MRLRALDLTAPRDVLEDVRRSLDEIANYLAALANEAGPALGDELSHVAEDLDRLKVAIKVVQSSIVEVRT
jgi:hypothetical protein